jgi:hypothetical protein
VNRPLLAAGSQSRDHGREDAVADVERLVSETSFAASP